MFMLVVLPFMAIFGFAFFAFKTAREYGRNAWLWALAEVGVGVGFQFVAPVLFGTALAMFWLSSGTSDYVVVQKLSTPSLIAFFTFEALSVVGMGYVLKRLFKVPENAPIKASAPSPISILR